MEERALYKKRFFIAAVLFAVILFLQMFVITSIPYALARIPYLVPGLFACFYCIVAWITVLYQQISPRKLMLRSACAAGVFLILHILCNLCVEYTTVAFLKSSLSENNMLYALFETLSNVVTDCIPLVLACIPFYRLRPIPKRARLYAVGIVSGYILLCFLLNYLIPHNPFSDFDATSLNSVMDIFNMLIIKPSVSYQIWQKSTSILKTFLLFGYSFTLALGQTSTKIQTDCK